MSLIMPSYCFVVLQRADYSCCLHSCCEYWRIQLWPNISPLDVSRPSSPPAAVTSSKAAAVLTFGAKLAPAVCATQKPAFSFLPLSERRWRLVCLFTRHLISGRQQEASLHTCSSAARAESKNTVIKSTLSSRGPSTNPNLITVVSRPRHFNVHICGFGLPWVYTLCRLN